MHTSFSWLLVKQWYCCRTGIIACLTSYRISNYASPTMIYNNNFNALPMVMSSRWASYNLLCLQNYLIEIILWKLCIRASVIQKIYPLGKSYLLDKSSITHTNFPVDNCYPRDTVWTTRPWRPVSVHMALRCLYHRNIFLILMHYALILYNISIFFCHMDSHKLNLLHIC